MNMKDIGRQRKIIYESKETGYDEFFKFNKIGDKITGILIQKTTSTNYGFGLYILQNNQNKRIRFHGSVQLDSLMKRVSVAEYIEIILIDTQKMTKGDMKIFIIGVSKITQKQSKCL